MLTITVIAASVAQIVLALFIYLKQKNSLTNVLFSLIILSSVAWVVSNYWVAISSDSNSLIFGVRAILFFVVLQNTLFCLFAKTYPSSRWDYSKKKLFLYIIFSALVMVATLTSAVFSGVKIVDGIAVTEVAPGIALFIAHSTLSITYGFVTLIRKFKKSYGQFRTQLKLIISSSVLIWIVVPVTNFIGTNLLQTTLFVEFSPVYTLIFNAVIAYTIISKKLFNIKTVVARTFAYFLLVVVFCFLYGSVVFVASRLVFDSSLESSSIAAFTIIAIFFGFTFHPLKNLLNKLTKTIFFSDSYESQIFIDEFNKSLVLSNDLERLVHNATSVISSYINPDLLVIVTGRRDEVPRIFSRTGKMSLQNFMVVKDAVKNSNKKFIVTDLVENDVDLKHRIIFENMGIGMFIEMITDSSIDGHSYLMLGYKKSGNGYTNQDLNAITIIANSLAIAIQNALQFEEIQKFAETLQDKVDDATKELRKTNDKLKQLDEAKDEFISMASHQLRTPLTSIKGYLSMLQEGDAGKLKKPQLEMVNSAYTSSQRMVYLIADLLNVSRLKTGKFVIEAGEVDLPNIIEEEIDQLKDVAKSRGLELTYDKPKTFPKVMLDETKIRQVAMNFIDNAIYYTPSGGKIKVVLEHDKDSIRYKVIDNGIGVPKEQQAKLFSKFYRADNAKKSRPDGTGLGLFMAKKVVVAQEGAVIFNSKPGEGSTFGFSFPRDKIEIKSKKAVQAKAKKSSSPKQK